MEITNLIIIGAGGHASVILDIIKSNISNNTINVVGFLDDNEELKLFKGYKVLGRIDEVEKFKKDNKFIIGIGNNSIRKRIVNKYDFLEYITLVHKSAIVGNDVVIREGSVIMPNVVINSGSIIGFHTIINTGAIVEHDNTINDFVHVSPSATLCGGVYIGESSHIGANSTVIQYRNIGENVTIGASSTVIKDIESNCIAVGTPARIIKYL